MPYSNPNHSECSYLVEFDRATVIKGDAKVLDDITFTIRPGENVALLGPNGSGKSSIIKTITRDYYPNQNFDRDPVKIFGQANWNVFSLRSKLGIVSADMQNFLHRNITVREIILSGFFQSVGLFRNHLVTPEMEIKTDEIMDFLGISHLEKKTMVTLSAGEERLVMIGKALIHNPEAMILDEPTNSLDFRAVHQFRETVQKIAQSGKSVILVTHNLLDIIPEINRVLLIKDGRIFSDGPKEEVLNSSNLETLFGLPVCLEKEGPYYYLKMQEC